MSETLVLSVGLDSSALDAREAVLRSAGYLVVSATSIREAIHQFNNGDFDLLFLCHTLPAKDRELLTSLIRASGSRIPVASISGSPGDQGVFSDATIAENPSQFLQGIKHLLAMRLEIAASGHRGNERAIAPPGTPLVQSSDRIQPDQTVEFSFPFGRFESTPALSRERGFPIDSGYRFTKQ